ncbi:MAG: cytochrome c biogenesis CcdA family protein [Desulfitobacteriaceae bacterium]
MEEIIQYLSSSLAQGSLLSLLIMFGAGLALSLNPCMGAMVPLVLGGNRQGGLGRSILFMGGFTVTLMLLGVAAASLGKVLMLPGWFWTSFLGILYLIAGLILLRVRLPITIYGFQVFRHQPPHLFRFIINREGLNPGAMGALFGLAPSPCTMPVILAVSAFVMAGGHPLFGALALGFFGLCHSLPLAFAFSPWVRNLFKPNRFTRYLRPALGIFLVATAVYFLATGPDFFNHNSMSIHNH